MEPAAVATRFLDMADHKKSTGLRGPDMQQDKLRDTRGGSFDPAESDGTAPTSPTSAGLPEGLQRKPTPPLNKTTGRAPPKE